MASGIKAYPFDQIEPKWQSYWESKATFKAADPGEAGSDKPKYYVLDMFPYPSASGLHVGHLEGYTATDIVTRYKRMKGFNVLHPMGWDAFGLPAEQHALETGVHPREATQSNIANFKRQIKMMGFSYDWSREVDTTDPHYYRWTQWIFMKLFEKGLAYEATIPVNWCPELGTVLANEEVIDGKSERGGHPVIRKPMRQWVLKITAYADRLLEDLDELDWSDSIKEMQRNWIGKSTGAEVDFKVADHDATIRVFTTRPDTLFGATYMVLAPELPFVRTLVKPGDAQFDGIGKYIEATLRKSDLDRTELVKKKTGVFTGAYAINPVNNEKIPIWIADYVLATYGTGAIMAVPAHDQRDYDFAKTFGLSITPVIEDESKRHNFDKSAFEGVGKCVSSKTPDGKFTINAMKSSDAIPKMNEWLEEKGIGRKKIQYKLRDWIFSRQRYWGEPIPIVHVDGKPQLISEDELPLQLPEVKSYKPTGSGEGPLGALNEWVNTKLPTGEDALRETNTMPQWAGSCWYYLRYLDPKNQNAVADKAKADYWLPVDLYVGGAEHAVLHLLYSRFWHKVLYDIGVVSTQEPYQRLVNQGMILGEDGIKMSKSRGNVVNPDEIVKLFGADSIRLYEMFMGPLEMTKPWSKQGVEGVYRFLSRVWRLFITQENKLSEKILDREPTPEELKRLHSAVKKVGSDLEGLRFNTAISALMVFVNKSIKDSSSSKSVLKVFTLLLAPFAPHIAEELWQKLGHTETLAYEPWPSYDEKYLVEEEVEIAVLIKGKVRGKLVVPKDIQEEQLKSLAMENPDVSRHLESLKVKKVIVVPGKIVNIVV